MGGEKEMQEVETEVSVDPEIEEAADELLDFETEEEAKVRKERYEEPIKGEEEEEKEAKESGEEGEDKQEGEHSEQPSEGENENQGDTGERQEDSDPGVNSNYIPYPRFKEVVDERNELRKQNEEVKASTQEIPDVKQTPAAEEKKGLSSEALEILKNTNPELYETYKEEMIVEKAMKRLEKKQEVKQKEQEQKAQVNEYYGHFNKRIHSEFKDLTKQESDWFKSRTPYMKRYSQEYPELLQDPGKVHLALRLADREHELATLRGTLKKEVKAEVGKNRANKKAAAMSGEARTPKANQKDDDPWSGPPEWETRKK